MFASSRDLSSKKIIELLEANLERSTHGPILDELTRCKIRLLTSYKPKDHSANVVNWHARLEDARSTHMGNESELSKALFEITRDFMQAAKMYGEIIIAERGLPTWEKSLKPSKLGGIAGGEKYVVGGILFKFSQDVELMPGNFMYGGPQRNEEAAHKASGHELKGIQMIMKKASADLRVPLMTLVQFRGCRLSAQSLLPLGQLIYGSADGAKTIHAGEKARQLIHSIQKLASDLNLADHKVTEMTTGTVKEIRFPVDIEIHTCASDHNVAFVIDTARLMPPVAPLVSTARRDIFYKLFRPEFVCSYKEPLSSDAFSTFGALDRAKHNAAIVEATRFLLEEHIPKVASQITLPDTKNITRFLQQRGINVRFIGLVRSVATLPEARQVLLKEMVARVVYKKIGRAWRALDVSSNQPFAKAAVDVLNDVISCTAEPWIRTDLVTKFGQDGIKDDPDLSEAGLQCLSRVCELAGIIIDEEFLSTGEHLSWAEVEIDSKVKELGFSAVAEADALYREAKTRAKGRGGTRAIALLRQAITILRREIISDPKNLELKCRLCRTLLRVLRYIHTENIENDSDWMAACNEFTDELCHLPSEGPSVISDANYFLATFKRFSCIRYTMAMEASDAARMWSEAIRIAHQVSHKENWLLVSESNQALRKLEKLRNALINSDFPDIVRSISSPSAYETVARHVQPFLTTVSFERMITSLQPDEWLVPKVIGLAFHLPDMRRLTGQWLRALPSLNPLDLTHEPVTNELLSLQAQWMDPNEPISCGEIVLQNLVASSFSPLLTHLKVAKRVVIDHCHNVAFDSICEALSVMSNIKTLELTNSGRLSGNAIWSRLPPTTETLVLTGSAFVTNPPADLRLPVKKLLLRGCDKIVVSADFLKCFPVLEELRVDALLPDAVSSLPETIRVLRVYYEYNGLSGAEFTKMLPCLEDVGIGKGLNNEGLICLCSHAPSIVRLRLKLCHTLTDEVFPVAFKHVPRLKMLDVRHCGGATDKGIIPALQENNIVLEGLQSQNAWGLTSASVSQYISKDRLHHLSFFGPRVPLVEAISSNKNLKRLFIGRSSVLSIDHWRLLGHALGSVEKIILDDLSSMTDEVLEAFLSNATSNLRTLSLRSVRFNGTGLKRVAEKGLLVGLKNLSLVSCCRDESALAKALEYMPSLESLVLDVSGESDQVLASLARHCKKLRQLSITNGQKAQTLKDPFGWLPRCASLRYIRITFMYQLMRQTLERVGARLGQLSDLNVDSLFPVEEPAMLSILQMRNLNVLVMNRTYFNFSQLTRFVSMKPPLFALTMFFQDGRSLCESIFHVLTGLQSLRFIRVTDFPAATSVSVPFWYESQYLDFDRYLPQSKLIARRAFDENLLESGDANQLKNVLESIPGIALRDKWAFMCWAHDEFSLSLLMSLVFRGYQVVVGLCEDKEEDFQDTMTILQFSDRRLNFTKTLMEAFGNNKGVYFMNVSQKTLIDRSFEREVQKLTPMLHVVFCFYPSQRRNARNTMFVQSAFFKPPEKTGIRDYLMPTVNAFVCAPLNILIGLQNVVRAAPSPRVVFHVTALASITETNSSSMHNFRFSVAGLHGLIKSMAYEFQTNQGIVIGVHPGLWFFGLEPGDLGSVSISGREAATRIIDTTFTAKPEHSGMLFRHPFEKIQP